MINPFPGQSVDRIVSHSFGLQTHFSASTEPGIPKQNTKHTIVIEQRSIWPILTPPPNILALGGDGLCIRRVIAAVDVISLAPVLMYHLVGQKMFFHPLKYL